MLKLVANKTRKWVAAVLAVIMLAAAAIPSSGIALAKPDNSNVVISQIYGGGGNSGAIYKNDFIELYNPTSNPVSLDGWSVQYASAAATGSFSSSNSVALSGTIAPGGYYLIKAKAGTTGSATTDLPEPDASNTNLDLSGTNGKVALVSSTNALGTIDGAAVANNALIVDFVGYGSATLYEGAGATPALSNPTAAIRKPLASGMPGNRGLDTNANSADFITGTPDPRNSSYGGQAVVVQQVTAVPAANAWPTGTPITLSSPTVGASVYAKIYSAGEPGAAFQLSTGFTLDRPVTVETYATMPGYEQSDLSTYQYSLLEKVPLPEARTAPVGRNVWTEGVVTHVNGQKTYIQKNDTALVLYGSFTPAFETGDYVEALGKMANFNGLQELEPVTGLPGEVVSKNYPLPAPQTVTYEALSAANGESYEAELVSLENVTVTSKSGTVWVAEQNGGTFSIYSASSKITAGKIFEKITGFIEQYNTGYQFIPLNDNALVENLLSVTATPGAGRIVPGGSVALASPATGAEIRYTLDGTEPTVTSTLYQAPIVITADTTIKAVAVSGGNVSSVYTFAYTLANGELRIRDIQGLSHTSGFDKQEVTDIEGIVTQYGYTFSSGAYKGFFIQDPQPDNNPATSEGIYVYSTDAAKKPAIGDLIRVSGTIAEYNEGSDSNLTSTQISYPEWEVVSHDNELPAPVVLGAAGRRIPSSIVDNDGLSQFQPEEDAIDFFESLEGMRVTAPQPTILSPYWASSGTYNIPVRVDNDSNDAVTPAGGLALKEYLNYNPQRILIAYGKPGQEVGTGDKFAGDINGVIGYNNGNFKLIPAHSNLQTDGGLPSIVASTFERETTGIVTDLDQLRIASYNIENFSAKTDQAKIDGIAKTIADNLKAPDIVGLVEVQDDSGDTNDGTLEAAQTAAALISAISAAGGPAYSYTDVAPAPGNLDGGAPGGNIRTAFLYNPARVTLAPSVEERKGESTEAVVYDAASGKLSVNPGRIAPENAAFSSSRKPLAAQFEFRGEKIIVIANHFNSKSGDNGPFGGVQPPQLVSEAQRHQIAQVVNGFVKSVLAADPDANVVALGDLNDFQFTPTVDKLKGNEMFDLIDLLPKHEQYTYTYDGNSQVLDHILATNSLAARSQVDIVHVNADFPESRGRLSDHDPVLAQMDLVGDKTSGSIKLQLLSVNDLHGKINDKYSEATLKTDIDGDGVQSADVFAGGMDYLATAIKARELQNPNTLLLHTGDMIGGSPPVSALFQDEPVVEIMEQMGFDAGVVGNHEFDEGTRELLRMVNGGSHPKGDPNYNGQNFPLLAANVVYKDGENQGKPVLDPYVIKRVEGVPVGFIGVVTQETPNIVMPAGIQDLSFIDPAEAVNQAAVELKAQGVKAIVVLAHMSASGSGEAVSGEAVDLAEAVDDEVDVIFAAHNHALVDGTVDGKLIVQAWEYGKAFADVDVEIDRTTGDIVKKEAELVYNVQQTADPAVKAIIDHYVTKAAPSMNRIIGNTANAMMKDYPGMGIGANGDRALGNMIADGMKSAMNADFALMNGGGVRENLDAGEITWGELYGIQPFNNVLMKLDVTGEGLEAILNAQLGSHSQYGPDFHVAGFRYTWYRDDADNRKVLDITLPDGSPIDKTKDYTVVVNNYMYTSVTNPKNVEISRNGKNPVTGPEDLDATVDFVAGFGGTLSYAPEGRILEVVKPGVVAPSQVSILYFNDGHEIMPVVDSYGNRGGAARVKTVIDQVAGEKITAFGGDLGGGTLFGGVFKGHPMVDAFNGFPVDLANFGQHDFDGGVDNTLKLIKGSQFSWITSNLKGEDDKPFADLPTYKVMEKNGIRVGFIGLTSAMDTTIRDSRVKQQEVIASAKEAVAQMKAEAQPDIILALTQEPVADDQALLEAVPEIAAVFTEEQSETETGVYELEDGRRYIFSPQGNMGSVVQLVIARNSDGTLALSHHVLKVDENVAEDAGIAELAAGYQAELEVKLGAKVAVAAHDFIYGETHESRRQETAIGNLIADAYRDYYKTDAAFANGGGIRASIAKGDVTLKAIRSVLPYGNKIVKVEVTGEVIWDALENGVSQVETNNGRFLQVSGLDYAYNTALKPGSRIKHVTLNGEPLDKSKTYTLALSNYMYTGGDGYTMFEGARTLVSAGDALSDAELLAAYAAKKGTLDVDVEGRIAIYHDGELPVWPEDAAVKAVDVTDSSVLLQWTPAADNAAIKEYRIYRDDAPAGTVSASVYQTAGESRLYAYRVEGLSSSTRYTFHVKAVDTSENVTDQGLTASATTQESETGDSDTAPAPSSPGGTIPPAQEGVKLEPVTTAEGVQLKPEAKDMKEEATADGRKVSVLALASDSLSKAVAAAGSGAVVIDLSGAPEATVKLGFPAGALADAPEGAIIRIKASAAHSYDLPVSVIKPASLAAALGVSAADLKVSITIGEAPQALRNKAEAAASGQSLTFLAEPVSYVITAEANGKSVEVNHFGNVYVSRTFTLNSVVNAATATAVAVDEATGAFSFVPAVFRNENGTTVVTVKRSSNSTYAIVQGAAPEFGDLKDHWSQPEVQLLAAKLVVNGQAQGVFAPDASITRAEFAALLVRALGLVPDASGVSGAKDAASGAWYAGVLGTAVKAGLMEGFEDGTFRPEAQITRGELAVMVSRAMKAAGKPAAGGDLQFADTAAIPQWARESVSASVEAGIIQGAEDNRFAPARQATRAEAAVMLKRLLLAVEFING
ncbi:5'-nucleotidase C-terminal domain-containing protein [Paenibacillus sp. YN15]|uniref:5'-nucleotidase C-terminal domain-containing protein n=1 Tax=Paenibacillus sp. YN15 TaxID=1742774 RepID=UPI000DCB5271|nr:5'-nucleotidase C-terminal domain-containing protein [Paenibacillus sp. YN15]RAU96550.1 hypothetical protein DQG13_20395 [Paenibacillus sp. YN15]